MTSYDSDRENGHDGSTQLDDRDVRALTEYMTVLHEGGDVYSVTTESGSEYRVDAREGRCTCPDHKHRGVRCKHRRRVAYATGEEPVPAWADTDAVDPQLGTHVDGSPQVAATDGGVAVESDDSAASVRPTYIVLGVDERGASHVYDTDTETVHIVHDDGSRGRRVIGEGQTVDEWMDAVADGWGWANRRYGAGVYFDRIAAAGGLDR
jgi:hypothetical protein